MKKIILPLVAATVLGAYPVSAQTINTYDPFNNLWNQPFLGISHIQTEPKMDVADLKDKIEVKAELPGMEEKRAHFHCWGRFEKPICPSPMIGGEPGGQFSSPAAVVEYENGQVDVVFAEHIRFTDRTEDTDE